MQHRTVVASSCIACHAYASFGADGQLSKAATAMLPCNPTGAPIPAVLEGSLQFDFMWAIVGTGVKGGLGRVAKHLRSICRPAISAVN